MALDGVLSTGSAYAQVSNGTVGTFAYAANDASVETSGSKAGTGTAAGGEAAPRLSAPAYISPVVSYDSQAAIAITQFRDSVTGAVDYQIPSRHVVEQYRLRATGAARYQGGNPLVADVTAPSNDQSGTGTTAVSAGASAGSSRGGTAVSSGSTAGSGSAVISATVAAVTLGAAAVNVMA